MHQVGYEYNVNADRVENDVELYMSALGMTRDRITLTSTNKEFDKLSGIYNCMFDLMALLESLVKGDPRTWNDTIDNWILRIRHQAEGLISHAAMSSKNEIGFITASGFKADDPTYLSKTPSDSNFLMACMTDSSRPVMFFASDRPIYGMVGMSLGKVHSGMNDPTATGTEVTLAPMQHGAINAIHLSKDESFEHSDMSFGAVKYMQFNQCFMLYNARSGASNWGFYTAMQGAYKNAHGHPSVDNVRTLLLITHSCTGYKRPIDVDQLSASETMSVEMWQDNPAYEYANSVTGIMLTPKVRIRSYKLPEDSLGQELAVIGRMRGAHQTIVSNLKYISTRRSFAPLPEPLKDVVMDLPCLLLESMSLNSSVPVDVESAITRYQSVTYNRNYVLDREGVRAAMRMMSTCFEAFLNDEDDRVAAYASTIMVHYASIVSILSIDRRSPENRRRGIELTFETWLKECYYDTPREMRETEKYRMAVMHYAQGRLEDITPMKMPYEEMYLRVPEADNPYYVSPDMSKPISTVQGLNDLSTLMHGVLPYVLYGDSQIQKAYRGL
jgi:hypothetical protein